MYYVNFDNLNKRWDAWVTRDCLNLSTLVRASASKSRKGHLNQEEEDAAMTVRYLGEARTIEYLHFADFKMKAWYFTPVPEPFQDLNTLFCCEFCMEFFRSDREFAVHCRSCVATHPPGDEIYRNGRVCVYEVDGLFAAQYCVHLCLITKLFLFHKTQYYDTRLFHFYIVCLLDVRGAHPVGFFSKEKNSLDHFNLACIEVFPCYQRMGLGRFLMQLSYEFSKIEKQPGSPEKPLSDLGFIGYRSYWKDAVLQAIIEHQDELISIAAISGWTGMTEDDVMFAIRDGKYMRKIDDEWVFAITSQQIEEWKKKDRKRVLKLDATRLRWTPYIHGPKGRGDT
jgi:hypothetical protein